MGSNEPLFNYYAVGTRFALLFGLRIVSFDDRTAHYGVAAPGPVIGADAAAGKISARG